LGQLQRIVVTPNQVKADVIHLNPAQLHYLSRVLRLKSGESFIAMDGQGQTWRAEWHNDRATIHESLVVASELPLQVTLAIALPKHGFDDVIRQVTELGVSCIVPIISDRTLLNPSSSKRDRWQKIIQEAAEQSERAIVPTILEPIDWLQYVQPPDLQPPAIQTTRLLAWERGDSPDLLTSLPTSFSASLATRLPDRHDAISVAIGPEGGWTDAEVAAAIAAGWQPISLGKRILRAVTASVAVMAIVAAQLERAGMERAGNS
jgi:16S rRNA (uracil1498-N3)-methyltransferase